MAAKSSTPLPPQNDHYKGAVSFITDVEGNIDYFRSIIRKSLILHYSDETESTLQFYRDDTLLVFGGDVCDKGLGSVRIVRQLNDLKSRYPSRVVFILGNRDINKLRITSELEDLPVEELKTVQGPYWVGLQQRVSPYEHLMDTICTEEKKTSVAEVTEEDLKKYNTKATRLRWMLDKTMGAQGDFDRRREELAIISDKQISDISDDDVVESFVSSVNQGGFMRKFLFSGKLGFIHRNTLFVHGAADASNFGYVPGEDERSTTPHEWVSSLNAWLNSELLAWVEQSTWEEGKRGMAQPVDGCWTGRGANRLLAYVAPGAEPSVVYQNMFDKANNCQFLDRETTEIFLKNGIRRICVGHQPHGNAPSIMKGEVEIIAADTSYSDMKAPDNRGKAWSEVVICSDGTIVHGVLPDENEIYYKLLPQTGQGDKEKEEENDRNTCYVGLPLRYPNDQLNGWWVKAQLRRVNPRIPPMYLLSKVDGFRVSYKSLYQDDVAKRVVRPEEIKVKSDKKKSKQEDEFTGTTVSVSYRNGSFPLSSKAPNVDASEVSNLPVFKEFLGTVDDNFKVNKMQVTSVDRFGPTIGFVHCSADVETKKEGKIPGIVFIRGESVAVLPVYVDIEDGGKEYIICLSQPRFATGNSRFVEVPAGMVNLTSETPAHAARRVLEEKAGICTDVCELLNMSQFHFGRDVPVFLSPGASDEDIKFFLYRSCVTSRKIARLTKKFKDENGKRTIIALDQLLGQTNDAKSWIAFSMYQSISHQFHN